MMEFEEFDKLEKYLNGELNQADKESLEQEIASNGDLKEKLALLKLTSDAAEASGVKEKLNQIHDELYPKNTKASFSKRYYYLAAACVSLLLIGWWLNSPNLSQDSLFAQHLETYPDYVTNRNLEDSRMIEAMNYYNEERYNRAVAVLEVIKASPELKEDATFYLGLSYLYLNRIPQSVKQLQESVGESPKYQQQARWYLSLAFLKDKQTENALRYLRDIKEGDFKYPAAIELKRQVQSLLE